HPRGAAADRPDIGARRGGGRPPRASERRSGGTLRRKGPSSGGRPGRRRPGSPRRHRNRRRPDMKYLDEFRDAELAKSLVRAIERTLTRPWVIMEICGGQTHSIVRYGIDRLLP